MWPLLSLLVSACTGEKTIIISADGFRWDYYGMVPTPGLDKLRANGVHVKNLINSFATVTFPNHYTLATGLYEESHGIVDNEMFDPIFNETFSMATTDPKWWQGGEPIWVTAEKAGRKSVCVNWVGCSIPVEGIRPSIWGPYDGSIEYNERVNMIADAVNGDTELGLLYFEEPDHSCHMHGPNSVEVREAITRVDQAVQSLLSRIDLNKVNVWPGDDDDISALLEAFAAIPHTQAKCHLKELIPRRLHYSNNRRIAPIVCIAQLGWSIVHTDADRDAFRLKGSHGYDASKDTDSPMRPIFLAAGPAFIKQASSDSPLDPFENVNVFPLLAELMGIRTELPPVNGTLAAVQHILIGRRAGDWSLRSLVIGLGFTLLLLRFALKMKSR